MQQGNGVAAAYEVLYNATVVEHVEEPQPLKEMESTTKPTAGRLIQQ